jgi:hypothetical protein
VKTKCSKTGEFSGWETPYEYCMCWQHCYLEDQKKREGVRQKAEYDELMKEKQ